MYSNTYRMKIYWVAPHYLQEPAPSAIKTIGLTRATFCLTWRTVDVNLPTGGREPPPVFDVDNSNGICFAKKRLTREGRMLRYDRDGPTGFEGPHESLRSIPHPELSTTKQSAARWTNPWPLVGKYVMNSTEKPQCGALTMLDNS